MISGYLYSEFYWKIFYCDNFNFFMMLICNYLINGKNMLKIFINMFRILFVSNCY